MSDQAVIRVMVVDDHAIVRDGIRLIMETVDHIDVVDEAENGQQALEQAGTVNPDVILMDLRMPVMDGLTAIEQLRRDHPAVPIIILTTYNEDELMVKGLQLGARGYLLKDVDRGTLLRTIEAAAKGDTLLQPEVLQRVLEQSGQLESKNAPINTDLTERELEVLYSVADGERNKEIAYRLGISERTVKAHLSHIFNKLNVDSRAAAVAAAAQQGLLDRK